MIIICPKALSSNENSHERNFLKFYLSVQGKKVKIANEVWETFRYKIINNSQNKQSAYDTIADYRGIVEPEFPNIGKDFQETDPEKEYLPKEMQDKTKDFLKRMGDDVDLFITQEPEIYKEICSEKKINVMTLSEFLIDCMNNERGRNTLLSYWNKIQEENWE